MKKDNLNKLAEKFIEKENEFLKKLQELEEEPMTEDEIIKEISMITKEIIRHKIEIRNLEKQLYKLEDLLQIK